MRALILAALLLAGCATQPTGARSQMVAADGPTQLIAGPTPTMTTTTRAAANGGDPLVLLELGFSGDRVMVFEAANHTAVDLTTQAPGGALAQIMQLDEAAAPQLFRARDVSRAGSFCAPGGPALIGVNTQADGTIRVVALKENFQSEQRSDGSFEVFPAAPSVVCSRLTFRRAG